MLDQSYNPNCWFWVALLCWIYIYSKVLFFWFLASSFPNLMLLFIDKVTTGIQSLALFQWNVSSQVDAHGIRSLGRLVFGLEGTSGVLYIFDIINFVDHDKSSFISQLIKEKSRDFQKRLLMYFKGTTTSVPNIL